MTARNTESRTRSSLPSGPLLLAVGCIVTLAVFSVLSKFARLELTPQIVHARTYSLSSWMSHFPSAIWHLCSAEPSSALQPMSFAAAAGKEGA